MDRISFKAARVAKNLTQSQLAEEMGVSLRSVNLWEKGKADISRRTLLAFCYVTGFKVDEIILPKNFKKK